MDEFMIRPARKEDVGQILAYIKELAAYERLEHEVEATEEILLDQLFEKKMAEVLMAEAGGEPAGYALFFHNFSTFLGRSGIYLEDLYIRPNYRGRGYGKRLLERLGAIARERGCGRLEWACLDWNRPSIDFYLSLGAKPMDEWTIYRLSGQALEEFQGK